MLSMYCIIIIITPRLVCSIVCSIAKTIFSCPQLYHTQFYGVMTGVYAVYAIAWLIVLGLNYTDLVRLQFWVLGVILLGFMEKALFLAEYDSVNKGNECECTIIRMENFISCLKYL